MRCNRNYSRSYSPIKIQTSLIDTSRIAPHQNTSITGRNHKCRDKSYRKTVSDLRKIHNRFWEPKKLNWLLLRATFEQSTLYKIVKLENWHVGVERWYLYDNCCYNNEGFAFSDFNTIINHFED